LSTSRPTVQHVEALSAALAAYAERVRRAIGEADDLDDADSADIFAEISRGTDKWLWFVEAHLQNGAPVGKKR
jgi:starvation-inducible DNA-binding protein